MPGEQRGVALLLPTQYKTSMTKFQIRIIAITPNTERVSALAAS
jgi:hypothetical protein